MIVEIYTYGGGDIYRLVFNGIALIFGSDDYRTALALSALLGFTGALMVSAFTMDGRLKNLQWLLVLILVYMGFLVPKVSVSIKDQTKSSLTGLVVDNVPLGLAVIASMGSTTKKYLTESFDSVFSMPSGTAYSTGGLGIGLSLVEQLSDATLHDPALSSEINRFYDNCIFYDIALGRYTWGQLAQSPDIADFLSNYSSQGSYHEYPKGSNTFASCRSVWKNNLLPAVNAQLKSITRYMASSMYVAYDKKGKLNTNQLIAAYATNSEQAAIYMGQSASSQAEKLLQNVMVNALKQSAGSQGTAVSNDALVSSYTLEKAKSERETTMSSMGVLAKEMLPMMQHVFELFIYCVFPVVGLMLMLPMAGQVAMGYIKAVVWVNLWSPLFVILNFVVSYYAQGLGSQYGDTTLLNNSAIRDVMFHYSVIAGYLTVSIPMIAWLLVSQSGAMMASLAGKATQSYESSTSRAADEASSGNIQTGSYGYQNQSMYQQSLSPALDMGSASFTTGSGWKETYTAGSGGGASVYVTQPNSNLSMQGALSDAFTRNLQNDLSRASQSEQSTARDYVSSLSTSLQQSQMQLQQLSDSVKLSEGAGSSENVSRGISATDQKTYGERIQSSISAIDQLSTQFQLSTGMSLGGFLKGSVGGSGTAQDVTQEQFQQGMEYLKNSGLMDTLNRAADAIRDVRAETGIAINDSNMDQLQAANNNMNSASERWESASRESQAVRQSLNEMESSSVAFKNNITQQIWNQLSGQEGIAQAQAILTHLNNGTSLTTNQRDALENALDTVKTTSVQSLHVPSNQADFTESMNKEYNHLSTSVQDHAANGQQGITHQIQTSLNTQIQNNEARVLGAADIHTPDFRERITNEHQSLDELQNQTDQLTPPVLNAEPGGGNETLVNRIEDVKGHGQKNADAMEYQLDIETSNKEGKVVNKNQTNDF